MYTIHTGLKIYKAYWSQSRVNSTVYIMDSEFLLLHKSAPEDLEISYIQEPISSTYFNIKLGNLNLIESDLSLSKIVISV
jgi:hypothetical protein